MLNDEFTMANAYQFACINIDLYCMWYSSFTKNNNANGTYRH